MDVNNPILGFFTNWVKEFSKHFEKITVICLEEGEHNLPDNVKVLSLGKEKNKSRINYVINFFHYIWRERKNYDVIFVHMNPEYIVLGGWFWRLWQKKVALWYVHRQTNFKLWVAEKFANTIFTSAPESFQMKSKKVRYVGHGIDIDRFKLQKISNSGKVLHVGRITRIKNIDTIIRALKGRNLTLVGETITADDREYKQELETLASEIGVQVDWLGAVSNDQLPAVYADHSISINASPDGGMDKSVLESLASGCPVFVCNSAFRRIFADYANIFMLKYRDFEDLREKLNLWEQNSQKQGIMSELSDEVRNRYDIGTLVSKVSNTLHG